MIIEIGRYQLKKIDSYNFGVLKTSVVKEGHKMAGCVYIDRTLYYPRFEQAITALFDIIVLDNLGESKDLEELKSMCIGCKEEIIKQLNTYQNTKEDHEKTSVNTKD